jgi:hypothetical protein
MNIAVITMSSLSLLASCGTLYLMYKTNQAVAGGVKQAQDEFNEAKKKYERNAAVVKSALGAIEL